MKRIKTDIQHTHYPVGENIQYNIPIIIEMAKAIKKVYRNKKDIRLICMGSSGAIISAIMANELGERNVTIAHVKKDGERSHSGNALGNLNDKKVINIIVDDFIETGDTMRKIYEKINRNAQNYPLHAGCKGDFVVDCVCVTGYGKELGFPVKNYIFSWELRK